MSLLENHRHPSIGDRLAGDAGLTLIEVLVSALMVALISLSLIGLDAIGASSADQQRRSRASEIAQQDQERMRAMSADQLQHLNQTRTVTLDNVPYTVTSTAQFLSNSVGSGSCTASGTVSADYAKVTTSVTWASNRRTPITQQSVITPPRGGSLLTQVVDQNNVAIQGATVTATGTDASTDAIRRQAATDVSGCSIFAGLLPGDYSVEALFSDYVDADGNTGSVGNATATAGNTATTKFTIGDPGSVTSTFWTRINSSNVTGQRVPSLSWANSGMATNGFVNTTTLPSSVTTPRTLFPFITTGTGIYTNNYALWAGRCSAAKPASTTFQALASPGVGPGTTNAVAVAPGSAVSNSIQLPALDIEVRYQTSSSTTRVRPDKIRLTDSCGQTWYPAIRTDAATSTSGSLQFPGQPYGATYSICAEDNGYRRIQTAANTTFTNGTTVLMTIDSRSSSNLGGC